MIAATKTGSASIRMSLNIRSSLSFLKIVKLRLNIGELSKKIVSLAVFDGVAVWLQIEKSP